MEISKELLKEIYEESKKYSVDSIQHRLKEEYPSIFTEIEVGNYYHIKDNNNEWSFYIKCTGISDEATRKVIEGYGVDHTHMKDFEDCRGFDISSAWVDLHDLENSCSINTISEERYMDIVLKYIMFDLGVKSGSKIKDIYGNEHVVGKGREPYINSDKIYVKNEELLSVCIYHEDKIVKVLEEAEIKSSVWKPTVELRYQWNTRFNVETITKQEKTLQQKWIEVDTGKEEWREVETV